MSTALLEKKFATMGARVKINAETPRRRSRRRLDTGRTISIDILRDKEGEYFDILAREEAKALVMDVQKKDRHLLLMARDNDGNPLKFLCGHDERHWFTCAVPGKASTVLQAKQALKPSEVVRAEQKSGLTVKKSQKRRRKVRGGKLIRQGEFMFIPEPNKKVDEIAILHNEPLVRGGGNPHMAQHLYRFGGITVYVPQVPFNERSGIDPSELRNGLTETEKAKFIEEHPKSSSWRWNQFRRDMIAYVKGRITHRDHATVDLGDVWHRVAINTENRARGATNVAFLD